MTQAAVPIPQYSGRKQMSCHIPLVSELIDSVEAYTAAHRLAPVAYNIETSHGPTKTAFTRRLPYLCRPMHESITR